MKRKQFHLSNEDEQVLYELSVKNGVSEAEIVREAIREYAKAHKNTHNSLVKMGELAKQECVRSPGDLSLHHDRYLMEIVENEE